jgi:hypothetical protein
MSYIKDPDMDTTEFSRKEVLAIYRHIYECFNNLYETSRWESVTGSLILRLDFLTAVTVKNVF